MIHLLHRSRVDRYFAGDLGPAATRTMFDDLWTCEACRTRYERHLLLEQTVARTNAPGADRLWQSIVATSDAAPERARKNVHPARRRALLALSLAVVGVLLVPPLSKEFTASPPVPRGAPGAAMAPSLHLYRTQQGRSEPVRGALRSDDGVLVAYSNPSSNLGYLMVFGVDRRGGVHWYYPAYDRPGEDPAAVEIRTRAFGVELGEEIRHPLPEGEMRMFALFLQRAHRVLEIEASIAAALAAHGGSVRDLERLPIVDGDQTSFLLEVQP